MKPDDWNAFVRSQLAAVAQAEAKLLARMSASERKVNEATASFAAQAIGMLPVSEKEKAALVAQQKEATDDLCDVPD